MMSANNCLGFLRSLAAFCCLAIASVSISKAEVLFTENFTYSNGEFGTASGGVWGLHSGSGGQTIVDNALFINDGTGGGDYSRPLAAVVPVNSGAIFAAFDLNVDAADPPTGTSSLDHYFAHFAENLSISPTNFVSRVVMLQGSTSGVYKLGIQRASGGTGLTGSFLPGDLTPGTTYRAVFSYDFTSQESKLWLNPTSISSTSVTNTVGTNLPVTGLNWFAFRTESGSSGDKTIDNLIVATTFNEVLGNVAQAGDFDGDGDVDGADFVIWQTNYPADDSHTLATGDADGDTDVDGADFAKWKDNFPHSPAPGVAPVPEPAAWILMALTLPALGLLRKKRSA
jgi:hypothetical protein